MSTLAHPHDPSLQAHDHDHPPHHHHHDHHDHAPGSASEQRISGALALTVVFMVVEVVAGFRSGSIALLGDAGHMLADAGSLALALVAQRVASRPRTSARTYGYRRAETLGAFANGVALGVTAVWVAYEAISRWRHPTPIHAGWMLAVATVGLVVNLIAARLLGAGEHGHNANTRAALAHVLTDAAGSVAAMGAAGAILMFGWRRADAGISFVLSALILWGAWRLIAQTVSVLMESTPPGLDLTDLAHTIRETPGVAEMHDLHAWTISDGFDVVTVHVVLDGNQHGTDVARRVCARVQHRHHVGHVTVQPEAPAPLQPASTLVRRQGT